MLSAARFRNCAADFFRWMVVIIIEYCKTRRCQMSSAYAGILTYQLEMVGEYTNIT